MKLLLNLFYELHQDEFPRPDTAGSEDEEELAFEVDEEPAVGVDAVPAAADDSCSSASDSDVETDLEMGRFPAMLASTNSLLWWLSQTTTWMIGPPRWKAYTSGLSASTNPRALGTRSWRPALWSTRTSRASTCRIWGWTVYSSR